MSITAEHRAKLNEAAISNEVIDAVGVQSSPKGDAIRFPWTDGVCATVWQARPDKPKVDDEGREIKYVFPKGAKPPLNKLRHSETSLRTCLVEGTKQSLAALSHAPADMNVWGMAGCWGFTHTDLSAFDGHDVYVILDADYATNPDVYKAAEVLAKQLRLGGAKTVQWVSTPGTGKEGLDDVLVKVDADKRADALRRWLAAAEAKLPRRPKAKRPTTNETDAAAAGLFVERSKPVSFQPLDAAKRVIDGQPVAQTAEGNIAFYRDGVFVIDDLAALDVVVNMLGNFYTPAYETQVRRVLLSLARQGGMILPERMAEPMLNCPNGMVDLRDGKLSAHDPQHLSYVQVAVEYGPQMPTPEYDRWLREALRQPGHTEADVDALILDLEETAGTMLDPSRTPSKALFLFGPSRSGKSTFLRLLKAVAGSANTSAVTLHQLAKDTFASANLYGKMLNVAADLSNEHVNDLSTFKMITGEDVVNANRKYGAQFTFTNQALIAFSANELPTVSEASRAYAERMKPFSFPNSFAGREDKHLEAKLLAELPGILARWVKAYGRFLARGGYGETDAATRTLFETQSDRVVQFFNDMCTVTEAAYGAQLTEDTATKRRDVVLAFNEWAERNGGSKMGERAFFNRFSQIPGVNEVKVGKAGRAYNVTVARADDDSWRDSVETIEVQPVAEAPQTAAQEPATAAPAPEVAEELPTRQTASQDSREAKRAAILAEYAADPWTAAKLLDENGL
ncbi:DNA primase [Streptomyces phage Mischief19]|nr:DNA primase [Streptomyces phage Mischief19]